MKDIQAEEAYDKDRCCILYMCRYVNEKGGGHAGARTGMFTAC